MKNFFNPFVKIAGLRALVWGVAGLAVCVVASFFSGWHAHGLLHFGPAPRDVAWISALEYLTIWLVPAAIFYGLGAALSRSRIRPVDVLGTTAFALLPLAAMSLWQLVPGVKELLEPFMNPAIFAPSGDPAALLQNAMGIMLQPLFIVNILIALAVIVVQVIWLFGAVKVSCNLQGGRLWAVYLTGLVGGDIICRLLIGLMY